MLPIFSSDTLLKFTAPIQTIKVWNAVPKVVPKYQNHAVLYPGLATPSASLALLHLALENKGIKCHEWAQGFNTGMTPDVELKAMAHLLDLMNKYPGKKWHLIGWSLGGVLARELAKQLFLNKNSCSSVVTMGTPINSMPDNPILMAIHKLFNKEQLRHDVFFERSLYVAPPCPVLCMYSQKDSVVPWKASIQAPTWAANALTLNHEIVSGHLTMPNHPETWTAIVQWIAGSYTPQGSHDQSRAEVETSAYWSKRTTEHATSTL